MNARLLTIVLVAGVAALGAAGCSVELLGLESNERTTGRILRVVDGDTVEVRGRDGATQTVRLLGIDTPETKRPGSPVECGGRGATDSLVRLAFRSGRDDDGDGLLDGGVGSGRSVSLRTDSTQAKRDRFDRVLAYVRIRRGPMLNVEQVRRGWAKTYVFQGEPFRLTSRFRTAQRGARDTGRGVWGLCGGSFHAPIR